MTARPGPGGFAPEGLLDHQERKSLLRFIVCGSVDHGKSTLIGRLLYEAGLLFVDQLDALDHDSRQQGMQGEERDFALVLDGLAAEREQKITIDVAYRFFSTARRKFIVADAPGHEQYTRNMATGASTADVALLLVSADTGLTRQTRRHAFIVSTLGVRRLVVAVNKMDLVGWSRSKFCALKAEFRAFAKDIEVDDIVFIPVAARTGDNMIARPRHMTWYRGPTLLEYLEKLEVAPRSRSSAFRMPVQCVIRPDSNFRGYGGLVAGASVRPGMPVQILPSGQRTHISRIVTADGDLAVAIAGQAVTLTFMDEIDASRGDVIAEVGRPAPVTKRFAAWLVWTGHDALIPGRPYLLKLAASTVYATIERLFLVVDLDTRRYAPADGIGTNDIASVTVQLDRPLALDRYVSNKETGAVIAASGGFASIAIAIGMSVWRAREAKAITTYGSARWATRPEVRGAGLLNPDGVVLGRLAPGYLRHDGPEHVLCFAPTRSGKGVGLVVPTLLTWPGSAIVHDIKGENWQLRPKVNTSRRCDQQRRPIHADRDGEVEDGRRVREVRAGASLP